MLYPKEDPDTHRLNFACRTCQYSEEAVSSCVFRNVLNNAVGETAGVTQDVGSDPTVCFPQYYSLCCQLCPSWSIAETMKAVEQSGSLKLGMWNLVVKEDSRGQDGKAEMR
jgi:DNA-directed RNA polymerase II subunit RPB9